MKFVLATQNPKKREEMAAILSELGVEIVTEDELGVKVEVEETGETFGQNAALKAKAVMEATGLPAIGDDSGLCVDALNGAPGIYSARYGGEGLGDKGRCELLLDALHGKTDRRAHFETVICCVFPDGEWIAARGRCDGTIAFTPMGENGFGYDPLFFITDLRKTFAQLTPEEKAAISHRGNALRAFKPKLAKYLAEHPEVQ
ncbi:MAG: RdgB/HAM1 family non-canonical purine NTP pyrophosphatase [Oscillospiraceae bacterium]|nr:RdgB/HAM1 family non-canonical purine NTP pyrophosphatase [Oscillospiraceae bacterium]